MLPAQDEVALQNGEAAHTFSALIGTEDPAAAALDETAVLALHPSLVVAVLSRQVALTAAQSPTLGPVHLPALLLVELLARRDRQPLAVRLKEVARRTQADLAELGAFAELLVARRIVVPADDLATGRPPKTPAAPPASAAALWRPGPGECFVVPTPLLLCPGPDGFEQVDHDGHARLRLAAVEVAALEALTMPTTRARAFEAQCERLGTRALSESDFAWLLDRLAGVELLQPVNLDDPVQRLAYSPDDHEQREALRRHAQVAAVFAQRMIAHEAAESAREARTGVRRVRVQPAHFSWRNPPVALGLIMAYASAHDGGALQAHYDFRPDWLTEARALVPASQGRCIYLHSHYVWSSAQNLEFSAQAKACNPLAITVHGGPDVPKYRGDTEAYFRAHPHVDVTIRGEGEQTTVEMLAALARLDRFAAPDLSVLGEVAGLSFRDGDQVVHTPERARMTDLDQIPSPYLTGLFDGFVEAWAQAGAEARGMGVFGMFQVPLAVIEASRGCPYACTFCDWGSATNSRMRTFDLERVFGELEWCAKHGIDVVGLADSNFGIWERDVEIATKVAQLRAATGYPKQLGVSYAKNTIKHSRRIVDILVGVDILAIGQLSLQTMDTDTLAAVRRSNIKIERYEELAVEFRRSGLPLFVELMMGLPGATPRAFRNDLQECIDRDLTPKIYPTHLLVNSPMNEPAYRETHGIVARPGEVVRQTASYTRAEWDEMDAAREAFLLMEKFGVLRHVARYVRHETGLREIDLFERLRGIAHDDPDRWPLIAFTFRRLPSLMVPPGSWWNFYAEVRAYLVAEAGIRDDTALDTVLLVQHALMPSRQRRFPHTLALRHDYQAWYRAAIEAKDGGRLHDWPAAVRPLRDYPSASLAIADPHGICRIGLGHPFESDIYASWELDSAVTRPTVRISSQPA